MKRSFTILNADVLSGLMAFVSANWEAMASTKKPMVVQVSEYEKKRTIEQNRRYWGRGVLAQIAEKALVGGKRYDAEVWHEQFKRMFIGVIELPNGEVVGKSSKRLNTKQFCDFCNEVEAYAASELGVEFEDLPAHEYDFRR